MRFSLLGLFATTAYVALTVTAIWRRSEFCATLLCASIIVAFMYAILLAFTARTSSRRISSQFGAVGSLAFFGVCVALWSASVFSDVSDELSFGQIQMRISNGSVTLCDHLENLKVIKLVEKARLTSPTPAKIRGFTIPGVRWRYITFADSDQRMWLFRTSLLVPAAVGLLAAILFIRSARRAREPSRELKELSGSE